MSIEVNNVTKKYGSQDALKGVSFQLSKGEIVGFLGPNGAGKSTMMKIITSYIPATGGQVRVCGFDVNAQSIESRRRIGYLPEHNPLYLDMYVREYLSFVAGIYKLKNTASRVEDMIDLVGLGVEAHKKIGQLSKGYRQRVGLAQALIHDPEVLILDEPTSGLDPNQLSDIRNVIARIGESKTVMLSTHIMQEVEAMCSRAIIIHQGQIVSDIPTGELKTFDANSTTEIYVEVSDAIDWNVLKSIEGVESIVRQNEKTCTLRVKGKEDVRKAISAKIFQLNSTVLTLQQKEEKLEDLFRTLTKK
ncbi:MAG: gliding motility-associated ABC transporter ATP-binding subunit GldA [Flavobacteriales bacterium]